MRAGSWCTQSYPRLEGHNAMLIGTQDAENTAKSRFGKACCEPAQLDFPNPSREGPRKKRELGEVAVGGRLAGPYGVPWKSSQMRR